MSDHVKGGWEEVERAWRQTNIALSALKAAQGKNERLEATIDRADKHTKMLMAAIERLEGTVKYLETEVDALCDPPAQARIDAALEALMQVGAVDQKAADARGRVFKALRGEK